MRSFCNNRVGIDVQPFIQLRSYEQIFRLGSHNRPTPPLSVYFIVVYKFGFLLTKPTLTKARALTTGSGLKCHDVLFHEKTAFLE